MDNVSAVVVNNSVTMLGVILVAYTAMYILEKIINFAIESFNGIETPAGWLKNIKFKGAGLGRKE